MRSRCRTCSRTCSRSTAISSTGSTPSRSIGLFALWSRSTGYDLVAAVKRRWLAALLLGLAAAGVHGRDGPAHGGRDASPGWDRDRGGVAWRGIVYGVTDGLLLSVFPILVVFAALAGTMGSTVVFAGKVAIGSDRARGVARDDRRVPRGLQRLPLGKMRKPLTGDVMCEHPDPRSRSTRSERRSPTPGSAPLAVLHSYETDTFLPPHR